MTEDKKELIAGCIAFFIALIVFYCIGTSALKTTSQTYSLFARFNQTSGLNVGGEVRLAGIKVGEIKSQQLDDYYGVTVEMVLPENVLLPDDSGASVQSSGIVGQKYVELLPGGSEDMLSSGGYIEFTQDSPNLQKLLDKVISMSKMKKKSEKKEI